MLNLQGAVCDRRRITVVRYLDLRLERIKEKRDDSF